MWTYRDETEPQWYRGTVKEWESKQKHERGGKTKKKDQTEHIIRHKAYSQSNSYITTSPFSFSSKTAGNKGDLKKD